MIMFGLGAEGKGNVQHAANIGGKGNTVYVVFKYLSSREGVEVGGVTPQPPSPLPHPYSQISMDI
jgi:hypothetical protein